MKPGVRGIGLVLVGTAALAGMMALVIRKGPIGALTVILVIVAAVTLLSGIAALFGKKKNG